MIKLFATLLLGGTTLTITSCNSISDEELNNYRSIDSALLVSTALVSSSTLSTFKSFESYLDFSTNSPSIQWYQKANAISDIFDQANKYILNTERDFLVKSGAVVEGDELKNLNEKSTSITQDFFEAQRIVDLNRMLTTCRKKALAVDEDISKQFSQTLFVGRDTLQTAFKNLPVIAAIIRLHKLRLDIQDSKNLLVRYCYNKVPK